MPFGCDYIQTCTNTHNHTIWLYVWMPSHRKGCVKLLSNWHKWTGNPFLQQFDRMLKKFWFFVSNGMAPPAEPFMTHTTRLGWINSTWWFHLMICKKTYCGNDGSIGAITKEISLSHLETLPVVMMFNSRHLMKHNMFKHLRQETVYPPEVKHSPWKVTCQIGK